MLWETLYNFWIFILEVYENFKELINYSFTIGDFEIKFINILTSGLITIITLLLIKKLVS